MLRTSCLLFGLALVLGCGDDGGDPDPPVDSGTGGGVDSGPGGTDSGPGGTDSGPGTCGPYPTPATIESQMEQFCIAAGTCELKIGDCSTGVITDPDEFLFSLDVEQNRAGVDEVHFQILDTDGDYVVSSTQGDLRRQEGVLNWVACDAEPMTCDWVRAIPVDAETTIETNRHRITFTYSSADESYTVTEFTAL